MIETQLWQLFCKNADISNIGTDSAHALLKLTGWSNTEVVFHWPERY